MSHISASFRENRILRKFLIQIQSLELDMEAVLSSLSRVTHINEQKLVYLEKAQQAEVENM